MIRRVLPAEFLSRGRIALYNRILRMNYFSAGSV